MKLHHDHIVTDPPYRDVLAAAGLNTVENILDAEGQHVVAWSRSSDTIRHQLPPIRHWNGAIFIKRYHYPTWKSRLKAMLRGTFFGKHRPRVEFEALNVMRRLGIPAVRPIAYGERRILHFVTSCFLVTEAVPDSVSLSTFAISVKGNGALPPVKRHRLIVELARKIRRMHDAGFAHGGMFWRNILLRPMPGEDFEYHFLDASPGKKVWRKETFEPNKVDDIAALRTLAGLFCSRADMIRFAKAYFNTKRFDTRQRNWLSQVDRLAEKYLRHETYRLNMNRLFCRHEKNLGHAPDPEGGVHADSLAAVASDKP